MLTRQYSVNPLLPAFEPDKAIQRPVTLPVGTTFRKGRVLGLVTYTAAVPEIRLLTVTGSPTGYTGTITFVADKTYTATLANAVSAIPTAAQLKTALESIFGSGNVSVSGPTAGVFTITFTNMLANKRIGGTLSLSFTFTAGSGPAAAFSTSQQGTCGDGQYDIYDNNASDGTQVAAAILKYDYLSDPQGGRVTEAGQGGQPTSPEAYIEGFFRVADLLGLDSGAVTDLGKLVESTSVSSPTAVLRVR